MGILKNITTIADTISNSIEETVPSAAEGLWAVIEMGRKTALVSLQRMDMEHVKELKELAKSCGLTKKEMKASALRCTYGTQRRAALAASKPKKKSKK